MPHQSPPARIYGTYDPEDHLSAFQILMPFVGASNATMCKLFPATIRGAVFQWYNQLLNGLFHKFEEFATLFCAKFFAQKRPNLDASHLMNTKQREYETLKEYYAQFSMIVVGGYHSLYRECHTCPHIWDQ
ncbi:unnamed protein product [Linum trigynum]|uniref:Retrotransposon gag domain-containing protein n=1 Tax=Linum trigynum TaxID=586398 RepID=A0AAV2GL61_9ROSI